MVIIRSRRTLGHFVIEAILSTKIEKQVESVVSASTLRIAAATFIDIITGVIDEDRYGFIP